MLNDFRASVDDEKNRRVDAVSALGGVLGLAKNPRLDAGLTVAGLLGDEWSIVNITPGSGVAGGFGPTTIPGMGVFPGLTPPPVVH